MIIIDTSAWIEYFRNGNALVVAKVERCLDEDRVAMGDLIWCEVMQGIRSVKQRRKVADLFSALPRFDMVGFAVAEMAAANYRLLRARGVTVRKTIDVLIATFCVDRGFSLVHHDRDFDLMASHIGLRLEPE